MFKAATAGKDACKLTFKARMGMTPDQDINGTKRDVSDFRAFCYRSWIYLDQQRRAKEKHTPRAIDTIYVEFAINTSALAFYDP